MVIGIVLAIGAVAIPFTLREIDRRQEAETIDRLGLLWRLARAEARATGVPVVIRVDARGRWIEASMLDPRADPDGFAGLANDVASASGVMEESDEDARSILAAWSRCELADGLRCVPPPSLDEFDAFGPRPDPVFDSVAAVERSLETDPDLDPWPDRTRLVLFMPDGSAVVQTAFGLATGRGWRRCSTDPYGGRLAIDPPADPEAAWSFDDAAAEDADQIDLDTDIDADPDAAREVER